jgi:hypothetical protein
MVSSKNNTTVATYPGSPRSLDMAMEYRTQRLGMYREKDENNSYLEQSMSCFVGVTESKKMISISESGFGSGS